MAKGQGRPDRRARAPMPVRPPAAERRIPQVEEHADAAPRKPMRSQAMRLAAEVDRLQQELLATRVQLADLVARVDTDPMLDIFNRRGFERELARTLSYVKRYGSRAALVYLDLDDFKAVNDRHGHTAGDVLLKAVSAAVTRQVRASDIVARIGGDEFAVLLWNLDEISAEAKARALEDVIAKASARAGVVTLTVQASAGLTMLGPLDSPVEVMERADRAMYARKAERRSARR